MKYRGDFVTNSSSSSFVCDVCGNVESGMDASLSDFDMVECPHGHTFCDDHRNSFNDKEAKKEAIKILTEKIESNKEYSKKYDKEHDNYYAKRVEKYETLLKGLNEIPEDELEDYLHTNVTEAILENSSGVYEHECPICTHNHITDSEKIEYMLKKIGMTEEDLEKEIKALYE